jgi:D-alanyl-D-alanine carboxypeptidase
VAISTRKLVGKDAMQGVFIMILHSDGDKEWQKSQLTNIERAVKNGDMDGQSYAYQYDRIQINSGKKQLYGTQCANVDTIKKTVELAPTEDMENLDDRRRKVGMMPIEMYKEFMLKNL